MTWSLATPSFTTSPTCGGRWREFHRVLRPGGLLAFAGEPSRYGDRLARLPKRTGLLIAPLWRRALRARPRPVPESELSNGHALESEVDVHAFAPASCGAYSLRPTSGRPASEARSSWQTHGAGVCARSSQRPSPNRSPLPGAVLPFAPTSPCRRSTPACWSPISLPSSSTTCSFPGEGPPPRVRHHPLGEARGRRRPSDHGRSGSSRRWGSAIEALIGSFPPRRLLRPGPGAISVSAAAIVLAQRRHRPVSSMIPPSPTWRSTRSAPLGA